jgi:hypothetical protein
MFLNSITGIQNLIFGVFYPNFDKKIKIFINLVIFIQNKSKDIYFNYKWNVNIVKVFLKQ